MNVESGSKCWETLHSSPGQHSYRQCELQFFKDYMQQTGGQAHLFFWMTVEGYRVTAQQQLEVLSSRQKDGKHQTNQTKGLLRAAAVGIYEQYLSEKVRIYLNLFEDTFCFLL